ncbi:MAG: M14 family metallopeptidase [Leptonema sp. (in: bacteria)]
MLKFFLFFVFFLYCTSSFRKEKLEDPFIIEKIHWYDYYSIIKVSKKNLREWESFFSKHSFPIQVVKEEDYFLYYKIPAENQNQIKNFSYIQVLKEFPFEYMDKEIDLRKKSKDIDLLKEGYKDYQAIMMVIDYLLKKYPNYLRKIPLGKTYQNRELFALQLTNHNINSQFKIPLYFNSLHHGNEILTVEYIFDMIFLLLGEPYIKLPNLNYEKILKEISEKERQHFLDQLDIFIIPIVNPDGLETFWYTSIHKGRKNARNVDLNRNYPFYWNSLKTSFIASDINSPTYQGNTFGSEIEVSTIIEFLKKKPCSYSISYHTFANKVLFPYSIDPVWNPIPDRAFFFGTQIIKNAISFRKQNYILAKKLYPVTGTDQDWIYNQIGCIAFLVEGSMNHPPFPIAKYSIVGIRNIWYNLLNTALYSPRLELSFFDKNQNPIQPNIKILNVFYFEEENISNFYENRWIFYLGPMKKISLEIQYKDFTKKMVLNCLNICKEKIYLTK